jgi:Mor family transcriptional regulator
MRLSQRLTTITIAHLISLTGEKKHEDYLQETDTISRMVYGMACAYMLTGKDLYLVAAEKGTEYLRDKMRFTDTDTGSHLLVPRSESQQWWGRAKAIGFGVWR